MDLVCWNFPTQEVLFDKDGVTEHPQPNGTVTKAEWRITDSGKRAVRLHVINYRGDDRFADITFDEGYNHFIGHDYDGRKLKGDRGDRFTLEQTGPNSSLLETLSKEAPNASAWVLAPLDQKVPGDIRKNLTYLREDLLDEGKTKPKATLSAYSVGYQLCNTMIAVLDEREQTLVRAGFRAVEAQARTGVTSQALEARRNYKMSWPQYDREKDQRNELKNQAINNAAVLAERPKVDWATRTAALRKLLDELYRQFREAVRQGAK